MRSESRPCSSQRYLNTTVFVVFVMAASGCGGSTHVPELGEVSGIVTLDEKPLANATVTFAPAKGRPSIGMTDTDGRFTLSFLGGHPGAILGTHKVLISTEQYVEKEDGTTDYVKESIPRRYNQKSELTADVRDSPNEFTFELSSR